MSHTALTRTDLERTVPSAFALAPHDRLTAKYGFIPTIELVTAIEEEGWFPASAQQSNVRDKTREGLQRHVIRFRQEQPTAVGDSLLELVLLNSHDGSSSFQLDLGLYRLVCSNGMVTPVGTAGGLRFRHGKEIVQSVIEGVYDLVDDAPQLRDSVEEFREISLDSGEQEVYARTAMELRYGQEWETKAPIDPQQLLVPRRRDDVGDSLWLTMNCVQENIIRGGIRSRRRNGRRQARTRPIRAVTTDVALNRALWRMTTEFAALKSS